MTAAWILITWMAAADGQLTLPLTMEAGLTKTQCEAQRKLWKAKSKQHRAVCRPQLVV